MIEINKIHQGDCRILLKDIPDNSVDFILTDPPYNVGLDYETHDDHIENYEEWCYEWINHLNRVLKEGHYCIIASGDTHIGCVLNAIKRSGLNFWHFIKWYRPGSQRAYPGTVFFNKVENWALCTKGKPDLKNINRKIMSQDIIIMENLNINVPQDGYLFDHPAKRPTKLYIKVIEGFTHPGDIVLDCFMGSGTTAIACQLTGRKFIGIEINQNYVNIGNNRLCQKPLFNYKV